MRSGKSPRGKKRRLAAGVAGLFGAFALGVVEDLFPEAKGFGRNFEILVLGQIFQTSFQAVLQGRSQGDSFAVSLRTHVG